MGFMLALVILWFVFGRLLFRPWSRRACMAGMHGGRARWQAGSFERPRHPLPVLGAHEYRPPSREVRREGALEALKRRYVSGELSDEQYEQELDTLFRTASGRQEA